MRDCGGAIQQRYEHMSLLPDKKTAMVEVEIAVAKQVTKKKLIN